MNILEAESINKTYQTHQALKNINLKIPQGSIFGLLGPNGAGKTTFIRIITQIISRDTGNITFNGEKLNERHIYQMGYLPEERGLYKKMKVGEQLLYLARLKGLNKKQAMQKLENWLEKFDIKTWWNKKVQDLSKGMQQKVQFVATVLHEPALLILDEPFSGFDPVNANLIKDEILGLRDKGCTIVFSTHRMESVEQLCDHLALIHKSEKILDGKMKEIKERFKTNNFSITYRGNLNLLEGFEIRETLGLDDNLQKSMIHLGEDKSTNELLEKLIPQVEIYGFEEQIPSINDIFISLVTGPDTNKSLNPKESLV